MTPKASLKVIAMISARCTDVSDWVGFSATVKNNVKVAPVGLDEGGKILERTRDFYSNTLIDGNFTVQDGEE